MGNITQENRASGHGWAIAGLLKGRHSARSHHRWLLNLTPKDEMPERRFPPPWSAEVQPNHYVVRGANKQKLAYVYYENEPGRRSAARS